MRLNTCRFCDSMMSEDLIKYGVRHYAHPKCYLDAGKRLGALPRHEIGRMPYFLLKERGLLDEANRLLHVPGYQVDDLVDLP